MLSGPSAIAFVQGDVVEAAKGLRDFAKANPLLVIKGGVLDGKVDDPGARSSSWPTWSPREVLLAKLAGAMKASMSGAAATFAALPTQMARLLAALEEKQASEAPARRRGRSDADGAPQADGCRRASRGRSEAADGPDEQDG